MIYVIKYLYQTFLLPPGIIIILLLVIAAVLAKRTSRAWKPVLCAAVLLYAVSMPLVSEGLIHALESRYSPPDRLSGDVIIMLGGGSIPDTQNVNSIGHLSGAAANRLLTCAQLYHKYGLPIIISGGQVFEYSGIESDIAGNILLSLGVPGDKVIKEIESQNTTQNAENTKALLEKYGFIRPVLVTSAFHMDRAVRQFEKAGVGVIPYPTDYRSHRTLKYEFTDFIADSDALTQTSISLKEYIGLLAVKWY